MIRALSYIPLLPSRRPCSKKRRQLLKTRFQRTRTL